MHTTNLYSLSILRIDHHANILNIIFRNIFGEGRLSIRECQDVF